MVTAIESDVVKQLMGSIQIDPDLLSTKERLHVFMSLCAMCGFKHMRGFKGLRQILEYDGSYGLKREATVGSVAKIYGVIPASHHFLELGSIHCAPHDKKDFETYTVPDPEYPGIQWTRHHDYVQNTLLVDRAGTLHSLAVVWKYVEEDKSVGMREYTTSWCAVKTGLLAQFTSSDELPFFGASPKTFLRSLGRLRNAQLETNDSIESELRHGQTVRRKLDDIIRRLGSI